MNTTRTEEVIELRRELEKQRYEKKELQQKYDYLQKKLKNFDFESSSRFAKYEARIATLIGNEKKWRLKYSEKLKKAKCEKLKSMVKKC